MSIVGSSCGNNRSGIGAVKRAAYGYLMAMANYKVDEAIPYCTTETQNGVLVKSREAVDLMNKSDSTFIQRDTPAKIEILSVEMINDTTAIAHYHKTTPLPKDMNGQVDLVKRDGKWLVHIPSEQTSPSNEKGLKPDVISKTTNGITIRGFKPTSKENNE